MLFLVDLAMRIGMRNRAIWKNFWMLHEGTPLAILAIASIP